MKKRIIVLNGIHASGKSTLAHLLADSNARYEYFPEIGAELRKEADFSVLHSSQKFDSEIMRRELARDLDRERCVRIPVVETWHFGSLAYILARSPELAEEYGRKIRERLEKFEPQAVFWTSIGRPSDGALTPRPPRPRRRTSRNCRNSFRRSRRTSGEYIPTMG